MAKREKARFAGGIIFAHIFAVLLTVFIGLWITTQYVAHALAYQPQLGEPMIDIGYPLYRPWQYFVWLHYYNAYAPDVFTHGLYIIYVTAFASVGVAIAISVWRSRAVLQSDTHGSARWQTEDEIVQKSGLVHDSIKGIVLGQLEDGRYLTHDGPEHTEVTAPARSGKGVGCLIPTLLTIQNSVIVNDIRGEAWVKTAGWRTSFSNVMLFAPSQLETAHYNPMFEIRRGINEVKDVQNMTDLIVDPDGKGKPTHWDKEGDDFLAAVILHVLYAKENKTLNGVVAFLENAEQDAKTILTEMATFPHVDGKPHSFVAMGAGGMMKKSPNEMSGVYSTAKSFLKLYKEPIVAAATAYSDFRIDDVMGGEYPLSLYLVQPPSDKSRLRPLYRLMLAQITTRLMEKWEPESIKHSLELMIDELPALGKLAFFEEQLGYTSGYKIRCTLLSQNDQQHIQIYGRDSILSASCKVHLWYAPETIEAGERISKSLGRTTETKQQKNYAGHRLAPWLGHIMISDQEQARDLMTPDEVTRLPKDEAIVKISGQYPIQCKKVVYYDDPNFKPRVLPPPVIPASGPYPFRPKQRPNDWLGLPVKRPSQPQPEQEQGAADAPERAVTKEPEIAPGVIAAASVAAGVAVAQAPALDAGHQDVSLPVAPTDEADDEQEKQQQQEKQQDREQAAEQAREPEVDAEQEQQQRDSKRLTPAQIAELDSSIDADKGRDHDGGLDLEMY
ncbi:IncP-type conjugal transfer protein TraG [Burkholderia sp. BCC1993]|uniref:IncP-type conjugal transfer protein TraG n=1 Tax=Burkholderia sp. BCC1993 TaxID=2817444 RepID=UPI002AB01093|nr:IncP-type conjugal transfer protein TraG [Burkholderia sp. BCC1993]